MFGGIKVVDVTPVLDTNIYASGDVLFVATEVKGALQPGFGAEILSIQVMDTDDQGASLELLILNQSIAVGTINQALTISDANAAAAITALVSVEDYDDLGGQKLAYAESRNSIANFYVGLNQDRKFIVPDDSSTHSFWVAGISKGTGTYTASGIKLRFILELSRLM